MACYCTLFDSGYLDRGCVMIESLLNVSPDSYVYVLAFDDKCYKALSEANYSNVRLISPNDFESERLLQIKSNRSHRSYCWTCTPFLLKYVLENRHEKVCTYIDADMYFFTNPDLLVDDVLHNNCDVGIVEHRFGRGKVQEEQLSIAGKYCVEFNTFVNNDNGLKVLNWWADKCEERCTDDTSESKDGRFGDQMYLDDWPERFDKIWIMQNHGGGVAPWNIYRYQVLSSNETIEFSDIQDGGKYELIFYHFHNLDIYDDGIVDINVYGRYGHPDKGLVEKIYCEYIEKLLKTRSKYSISSGKNGKNIIKDLYPNIFSKLRHFRSYIRKCRDIITV